MAIIFCVLENKKVDYERENFNEEKYHLVLEIKDLTKNNFLAILIQIDTKIYQVI